MVPVLVFLGVLLFVSFAVFAWIGQKQRREALLAYCQSQGWTYVGSDGSLAARWNGQPFGKGQNQRVKNAIRGVREGRPFTAFDYSYTEQHSDSKGGSTSTTYSFSVVAVALPAMLPGVEVVPDGMLSRAAAAMGMSSGIELESEDFNRRFRVTGRDPKFASDILSPRTMEMLLVSPKRSWRIEGGDILTWDTSSIEPVQILAAISALTAVLAGIPTFVWRDHGYDPTS